MASQPESHSDKGRIILVGIVIIAILIVIYTLATEGVVGLYSFVQKFLIWGIVLAMIGVVVFGIFKYMQKPPVDLVSLDMQNIVDAGILSKPPMLKDLYFTGDKEHGEFRVGKIIGYCQLQSYKDLNKIASLSDDDIAELRKQGINPSNYIIKEDCFVFKKYGFPLSLFEQPKVLRLLEDEHSQLVGDVKVYAVSMLKKYSFYWPNRGHLDVARIDHAVIKEAWRGGIHEFLKDMVSINQRASGLDADHRKEIENRKLLKIPNPMGEQEQRS